MGLSHLVRETRIALSFYAICAPLFCGRNLGNSNPLPSGPDGPHLEFNKYFTLLIDQARKQSKNFVYPADKYPIMEISNKQSQILQRLKSRGPQSVRILASQLGITTMGVRQHLAAMEKLGLVKQTREARQNRGRPVHLWALSGKGHARFPDRHQTLSLDLIEAIDRTMGSEQLASLISECGSQQVRQYSGLLETAAGDLGERLRLLAELRTEDGFMAEIRLLPEGWLLIENHCPLHAAARRCPAFCDAELSMLRTLLLEHAEVERADHLLAGARRCAFKITVKAAAKN